MTHMTDNGITAVDVRVVKKLLLYDLKYIIKRPSTPGERLVAERFRELIEGAQFPEAVADAPKPEHVPAHEEAKAS